MDHSVEVSVFAGKKIAAGICGILFGILCGGLGIHKFILGQTNAGAIMLAVSLGSLVIGFFTCGVGWIGSIVMGVISLIEGIIYLTKPDEIFYQEYAIQKKQWF